MDPYVLKTLNAERRARRAAAIITDLGDGRDRIVREADPVAGELGAAISESFRTGRSRTAEIGDRSFFINVHVPPPRLVVIGAVHISQALAPMAAIAGFPVELIDPRTAFASPERFSDVTLFSKWPLDVFRDNPLDAHSALAAITHDPKIDDDALVAALQSGCFYVGALGGRATRAKRIERLKARGLGDDQIARIHGPIGLDIGASNPAEIAVAILAEVIACFRARSQTAGL